MISRWIEWSKRQGLIVRLVLFYGQTLTMAAFYVGLGLTTAAATAFSLMCGLTLAGVAYSFKPFNQDWGTPRRILTRLLHTLMTLGIAVVSMRVFLSAHGELITNNVGFAQRVWAFGVVGIGILIAAITLGIGRFKAPEVLTGRL